MVNNSIGKALCISKLWHNKDSVEKMQLKRVNDDFAENNPSILQTLILIMIVMVVYPRVQYQIIQI